MQQRAHQSLTEMITGIVILARKILFADMIEDIVDTRRHLLMRQCHRIARIQDGKARHDLLIRKDMTDLHLGLGIRNDCARVHL